MRVSPHAVGELVIRSTKSMLGYWHQPDATAATFSEGWLLTGDLGRYDEAGYFYLVDRKKDLVISGGMNVYPSEIERVLLEDEAVSEVAVIGVPDERWGEVPMAFVVASEPVDRARLLSRCRDQLAGYKQPRRIEVVDQLPRNATGKVQKTVLREQARGFQQTSP